MATESAIALNTIRTTFKVYLLLNANGCPDNKSKPFTRNQNIDLR